MKVIEEFATRPVNDQDHSVVIVLNILEPIGHHRITPKTPAKAITRVIRCRKLNWIRRMFMTIALMPKSSIRARLKGDD